MFNREEKRFWKNYKDQLLQGISDEIKECNIYAATKLICCAIDALACFYVGLTQDEKSSRSKYVLQGGSRKNPAKSIKSFSGVSYEESWHKKIFNAYIKNHIDKLFKNKLSVDFYNKYRNGLIHEGIPKYGFDIDITNSSWIFRKKNNKIFLNAKELYNQLKKSMKLFDKELSNKDYRLRRWRERYNYLQDNYLQGRKLK